MMKSETKAMAAHAYDLRQDVLDIIVNGGGGHIGGDMSSMEIMMTLYSRMNVDPGNPDDPNRDRFVLSKGHCVETLYAVLADKGFLDIEEVKAKFSKFGSEYIGHPHNTLPGIEMNSGSLGHGLSVSVGMALAGRMDGRPYRVYTLMGDGELAEGSIWEALMAAGHYRLDNLCAVIDRNHLQISGNTEDVMGHHDLHARFAAAVKRSTSSGTWPMSLPSPPSAMFGQEKFSSTASAPFSSHSRASSPHSASFCPMMEARMNFVG